MKKLILLIILSLGFISCNSSVEGEGPATMSQQIAIDSFQTLEIDCNCDVTLIPSEKLEVVLESHQNLIDNFKINSKKNSLLVTENSSVSKYSLNNVNIYFNSDLKKIKLSGETKLQVSGTLKSEDLEVEMKNNSDWTQTFVEIKNLKLNVHDQGLLQLGGTVIDLKLKAFNTSNVNLSSLQTVEIDFETKDNSELSIQVLKKLKGTAYGNSIVYYQGDPVKNISEKDKGSIKQK